MQMLKKLVKVSSMFFFLNIFFCTPLKQQWSSTLSAPIGDQHQLLCSTYEDEIWRHSFLCGRASCVEQFASGSSSRRQFTLL